MAYTVRFGKVVDTKTLKKQRRGPYLSASLNRQSHEKPTVLRADKGLLGGSCNVTACQRPGAFMYNKSTKAYYCHDCATEINWPGGRELTMEIYGRPLLCEPLYPDDEELHVDDWLDTPTLDDEQLRLAKEWVEHFRRPAGESDAKWLDARLVTCIYHGELFRVSGASRMGDLWLNRDLNKNWGHDLRVNVARCSEWSVINRGEIK